MEARIARLEAVLGAGGGDSAHATRVAELEARLQSKTDGSVASFLIEHAGCRKAGLVDAAEPTASPLQPDVCLLLLNDAAPRIETTSKQLRAIAEMLPTVLLEDATRDATVVPAARTRQLQALTADVMHQTSAAASLRADVDAALAAYSDLIDAATLSALFLRDQLPGGGTTSSSGGGGGGGCAAALGASNGSEFAAPSGTRSALASS